MRAYLVAVRGFNFKLVNYQKVISAPLSLSNSSFAQSVANEKLWGGVKIENREDLGQYPN